MSDSTIASADGGLIGLAVMGRSSPLNLADHGNRVAVYNLGGAKTSSAHQPAQS